MGNIENTRYPIGKEDEQPYFNSAFSEALKNELLLDIKVLPVSLEMAIQNMDAAILDMPYRPESWTVNQLVHHVADSHINAYTRFKLGLTELNPVIKPYDQEAWALLNDSKEVPINVSLTLLHALHQRWFSLLKGLSEEQWERTIFHPEKKINISLWDLLKSYAWHGKHHVAQVISFKNSLNIR
jgi:uncharacterized damage-inducible protein DinB